MARIDSKIRQHLPDSIEYRCLTEDRTQLNTAIILNSILNAKARTRSLSLSKVIGDGNCLQYAVNAAHRELTNHYLEQNDNLRLLATALSRSYAKQQNVQPEKVIEMELKAIELTAKNLFYNYSGTFLNAHTSIRHGPIIVLTDTLGEEAVTYPPLREMAAILNGLSMHQALHALYLPPI